MGILVLLLIVLGFSVTLLGIGAFLEQLLPKPQKGRAEYMNGADATAYIPTDGQSHHSTVTALEHCVHIDLPSCDGFF